jgi:hypothetical protein
LGAGKDFIVVGIWKGLYSSWGLERTMKLGDEKDYSWELERKYLGSGKDYTVVGSWKGL